MTFSPTTDIIRTRRKSYSIEVRQDGSLLVRAPLRATQAQIAEILAKKASWIQGKQAQARARAADSPPKNFSEGEGFLYLGNTYPLVLLDRAARPLDLRDGHFYLIRSFIPRAQEVFERWYREQARQVIRERVARQAARNGFYYQGVRINGAKTRWGSCGIGGTLNFTWRLVMAPLEVVDYVVVHELAHLEIKNHSRVFWDKVRGLMPDYKERVAWLKKNGHRFNL